MSLAERVVDALPKRLWRPGNLYMLPGGDWHFSLAGHPRSRHSVRTVEWRGRQVAHGRRSFRHDPHADPAEGRHEDVPVHFDGVLAAVEAALAPYGPDAAAVTVTRNVNNALWEIDVQPANPAAAHLNVLGGEAASDDEITMTFGETHIYIWGDPAEVADWVSQYAEAIFAGRFDEAGSAGDARARIHLANGEERTVGSVGLPVGWHRKRRTLCRLFLIIRTLEESKRDGQRRPSTSLCRIPVNARSHSREEPVAAAQWRPPNRRELFGGPSALSGRLDAP